jgi:bifunctional polynucleotide phosphatase/kinase
MLRLIVSGLYGHVGTSGTSKYVAAFDLDGTLIRTIHGKFFKDSNDWAFLPNRILGLKTYRDAGYTLVIFTNQHYKGAKLTAAIDRVNNVIGALRAEGLDPWVLAATQEDMYRKPNIGMWQVFVQYFPNLDLASSLYIGDAAGRPQDHSDSDRVFAQNIGIPFYTPEDIFPNNQIEIPETQTMFIFVGMPGSGKSSYFEQNLAPRGWVVANQDTLKTQPKMLSTIRDALASGRSVAVDATNPSPDKRREYIMLAIQYQVPTLIIYFVRDGHGWNSLRPHPVPNIAYNMYYKNLVEPTQVLDLVPVVEIF